MSTRSFLGILFLASFASLVGCGGGDDEGNRCGSGTVAMGGECVPTSDVCSDGTRFDEATGRCVADVSCAPGTVAMGGECVPDGSVVCGSGTTYDATTGTCLPDISGCAEGTVLVDGACVPFDDTLVGDVSEGAEPNDALLPDGRPATFELGAVGADPVTMSGCVTPDDFDGDGTVDIDMDSFLFDVDRPTSIDVTVDGKGGLSAGFVVFTADGDLARHGWVRYGVDLVSDGASRKVFLPAAGTYAISVGDSRAMISGEPAGGMDSCYFMQVAREELPEPVEWTGEPVRGPVGDPVFYSMPASTAGQLLFASMSEGSAAVGPSIVAMLDDEYLVSVSSEDADVSLAVPGLSDGGEVVIVADHAIDFAIDEVEYELEVTDAGAQPLPADGTATLTHSDDLFRFLYFTADAGDVVRIEHETAGDELRVDVINPDFTSFVANVCSSCDSGGQWMQIVEGGTYYVRLVNDDGTDGVDYDVDFVRTHVTPTSATTGTPVAGSIGTDVDRAFFSFDATGEDWIEYALESFGGTITDALIRVYPRDREGSLGDLVVAVDSELSDGTESFERIYAGEAGPLLLVVTDADGADGDETFDLAVRQVEFQDLGTVGGGGSVARTGEAVEAGTATRYLVRTGAGNLLDITATPTGSADLVVELLDREAQVASTVDEAGAGEAEMVADVAPVGGVLAFRIREAGGGPAELNLQVDAQLPPYAVTAGTVAFVDICPSAGGAGVVHMTVDDATGFGADDEGLSETPLDVSALGFELFGEAVTTATLSTNGWLTFDAGYSGNALYAPAAIPNTGHPNALIAPFWFDAVDVQICTLVEADRIVVQWTGDLLVGLFSTAPGQVQTILHSDGHIDFVYGEEHGDDGSFATIGIENGAGTHGIAWTDPVAPGTSLTFTPR